MRGRRTGALATNCGMTPKRSHWRRRTFSDRANENPFLTDTPAPIFAHLLTFRPTAEEPASWLCHDEEIDRRVHGTAYASIIDRQAPAQPSGVLAALDMVADTLKLLPPDHRRVDAGAPLRGRVTGAGGCSSRWDSGRTSSVAARERRYLDYGYALTSHSSPRADQSDHGAHR